MKRICAIIFILSTLMFIRCTGPMGPQGFMGFRGLDGKLGAIGQGLRGDFELLEASILILKSSYYYNYQLFDLKRENFNNSIAFEHSVFQNEFNTDQPKDYVYAGLRHDESNVSLVEEIVAQLTGNVANSFDNDAAKHLLLALRDSAKYVYEFMDFFLSGVGLANFRKYDEPYISELCVMAMDMFRERESVLDDIQSILIDIRFLFKDGVVDIAKLRSSLNPIINIQGKIYEKIYIGNRSLKGLRDSVKNKIDELK
ncbi:hypothetical protein bpuCAU1_001226 (plasmid) [Borrelia puertoricensis]|uniref:hypothetical protein n=2 Tax=Borrelia puertoricensis TaxID=2756107 RepID=UPI003EBBBAAA